MKTSVVMATFNGEAYLQEQLESLAGQIQPPDELIVADDGSNDKTIEIVEEFTTRAPFPTKILKRTKRLGYAANFADAALYASGDVLLFCDQDDWWKESKIKKIKEYFDNHPSVELVTHNIAVCDEMLRLLIADYFKHFKKNEYNRLLFIKGCATAIRKSLRDRAFPLPTGSRWTHDGRVHALAHMNNSFGLMEDILLKHRIHSSNTSGCIVNKKKPIGLFLAMLDSQAIKSFPYWRKALMHFPLPPISKSEVTEFLNSCTGNTSKTQNNIIAEAIQLSAQAINERALIMSLHSRFHRGAGFIRLLAQGKYKNNGSGYSFVADFLRSLKSN